MTTRVTREPRIGTQNPEKSRESRFGTQTGPCAATNFAELAHHLLVGFGSLAAMEVDISRGLADDGGHPARVHGRRCREWTTSRRTDDTVGGAEDEDDMGDLDPGDAT
jgi:hypothetical protein